MSNTDTERHVADVREIEGPLLQIAQRLTPCPIPDLADGWDLCAHGLPWPCPPTEAAWIARGLDCGDQVHAHDSWLRAEQADAYSAAILGSMLVRRNGG